MCLATVLLVGTRLAALLGAAKEVMMVNDDESLHAEFVLLIDSLLFGTLI